MLPRCIGCGVELWWSADADAYLPVGTDRAICPTPHYPQLAIDLDWHVPEIVEG